MTVKSGHRESLKISRLIVFTAGEIVITVKFPPLPLVKILSARNGIPLRWSRWAWVIKIFFILSCSFSWRTLVTLPASKRISSSSRKPGELCPGNSAPEHPSTLIFMTILSSEFAAGSEEHLCPWNSLVHFWEIIYLNSEKCNEVCRPESALKQ